MGTAAIYAIIASSALPVGAWLGAWHPPARAVTAALLAFASGALITAVAFELFDEAFRHGGAWRAGVAYLAGASVFIAVDTWLDRYTRRRQAAGLGVGFALLAGVTLDGVPENVALGVALVENRNPALLVAILVSNLPESIVGAQMMRSAGLVRRTVMLVWGVTALVLGLAVIVGYSAFSGVSEAALALPLGFAAGAVLASLADTLMPEAFDESRHDPRIAYFTALGFLLSFLISAT